MPSLYALRVMALKSRFGAAMSRRYYRRRLGARAGWLAEDWIGSVAPGKTFIDLGGMWGINGEHSFTALRAGAAAATLVDLYATPEFQAKVDTEDVAPRFIRGEADNPEVVAAAGPHEVVWCWGVIYHHPNPHRLLAALRQMCTDTLVLEGFTAAEVPGVPQAAVYLPYLADGMRSAFDTSRHGGARRQLGVSTAFDPTLGYANNFFALTPSAVRALLTSVGFRVEATYPSPSGSLRHVFLARVDKA